MRFLAGLRADRWRALLVGLALTHVVLRVAMFFEVRTAPLRGDGSLYADAGRAVAEVLHRLVTGHGLDVASIERNVVGMGWFMPGMTLVQTPLFLLVPHASPALVHAYNGALMSALLLVAAATVARGLGPAYGCAVLVFPGLLPMWVLYTYQGFGDAPAGLLVVILLTVLVGHARQLRRGAAPSIRSGLGLGLLLAITLYLRSSALPLVVGLLALAGIAVLAWSRGGVRRRGLAAVAVAGVVFSALLAPWSVLASHTLHGRVLTTSTLPLSKAVAFGNADELCFGRCTGTGGIWFKATDYSRRVARATGVSELDVQQQMSRYATRGTTVHSYAKDVIGDFGRYTLQPSVDRKLMESGVPPALSETNRVLTDLLYYLVGAVALVALLWPRRRSLERQVVALLASLMVGALMVQPFVHICSHRYWPVFAPLLAIAAVVLVLDLRRSGSAVRPADLRASRWLWLLQCLVPVVVVGTAVGLGASALT